MDGRKRFAVVKLGHNTHPGDVVRFVPQGVLNPKTFAEALIVRKSMIRIEVEKWIEGPGSDDVSFAVFHGGRYLSAEEVLKFIVAAGFVDKFGRANGGAFISDVRQAFGYVKGRPIVAEVMEWAVPVRVIQS